jgi:hypothetical protein
MRDSIDGLRPSPENTTIGFSPPAIHSKIDRRVRLCNQLMVLILRVDMVVKFNKVALQVVCTKS